MYKSLILITLVIFSCSTKEIQVVEKPVPEKVIVIPEPKKEEPQKVIEPEIKTGWEDEDTYTVHVTGTDEKAAIGQAKHQILKDIVSVRVKSQSPYTDISKIQAEFSTPLDRGVIIKKNPKNGGIEIYYRITDKGLKKKFERK